MNNLNKSIDEWIVHHKLIASVGGIGLIILLVSNYSNNTPDYKTFEVIEADLVDEVKLTGTVTAVDRADLSFEGSGKITSINVASGSRVKKGQAIATLSSSDLYAEYERAKAGVESALAGVDQAEASLKAVKASNFGSLKSLDNAVNNLDRVTNEQDQLVDNAYQSLINNDLQAYSNSSSRYAEPPEVSGVYNDTEQGEYQIEFYRSGASTGYSARYTGLESGTVSFKDTELPVALGTRGLYLSLPISDSSYSNANFIIPIPNTRSSTYQTVLNNFQAAKVSRDRQIELAQAEVDRLKMIETTGQLTSAEESRALANIRSAKANLLSARAQVALIRSKINDRILTAPFSGVFAKSSLKIGETVTAGQIVGTLVTKGKFEIELKVPEIDVAKLKSGMLASVQLDAYGADIDWEATVQSIEEIETIIEGVPVYRTTLAIHNPDDRIKIGMNARAAIAVDSRTDVLTVPISYVLDEGGQYYVLISNADQIEQRSIKIGFQGSNSMVEILDGLDRGQVIIKEI